MAVCASGRSALMVVTSRNLPRHSGSQRNEFIHHRTGAAKGRPKSRHKGEKRTHLAPSGCRSRRAVWSIDAKCSQPNESYAAAAAPEGGVVGVRGEASKEVLSIWRRSTVRGGASFSHDGAPRSSCCQSVSQSVSVLHGPYRGVYLLCVVVFEAVTGGLEAARVPWRRAPPDDASGGRKLLVGERRHLIK